MFDNRQSLADLANLTRDAAAAASAASLASSSANNSSTLFHPGPGRCSDGCGGATG